MIYIFCALYHEAEPLIREYGLKKKTDETCFPVFFSEEENILLTVTGCGMNAATAAVARICTKRTPQPADFLVNIGTCAKVSYSKGSGQTCRNVSEKETAAGDGLHSSDKRKTVQEQSVKAGEVYLCTYGRMTKPVVNTLLAKMYLNAEVYTGTPMYDQAVSYANKVIHEGGFGLEKNYRNLFCGENHLSPLHGNEIIFAIPCDGENAKSYGNSIMVTAAAYGGLLNPKWLGMDASWTCLKPCSQLVKQFDYSPVAGYDHHGSTLKKDSRFIFFDVKEYVDGENGDNCTEQGVKTRRDVVPVLTDWNSGYLCHKFTNLGWDQNEVTPSAWPDTDFPLFRLADIYLIYAECAARQATGADVSTAVGYINLLRERANGDKSGNISASDLTLDFILAERSRELYWEGQRRSDLIRFGKFTKEYAWDYKGGPQEGIANIDSKFNIYPISDKDLTANPNLVQNPGYATLK